MSISAEQIFDFLLKNQSWASGKLQEFQHSQLEQLLRHARRKVPFYGERLDAIFSASGQIKWDRWSEVPILTRKQVSENFSALQAVELPLGHGRTKVLSTSGSTGLPVSVTITSLLSNACRATDWRAHASWNLNWSDSLVYLRHAGDVTKYPNHGPSHDFGPWGPKSPSSNESGRSFVLLMQDSQKALLRELEQSSARYLVAQGNVSLSLALNMKSSGAFHPLGAVLMNGIQWDEQMGGAMSEAFGAKCYALYSSKEGGRMANMCHLCQRYHVNAENVLIEILDANNRPCPPGVPGRVVVTNFYNAAQPFIRYEQGDIACWSEKCDCGTSLPVIERIDGREYHMFQKLDGTRYAPLINDHCREALSAEFWQFVQTAKDALLVRYKPTGTRDLGKEVSFIPVLQQLLNEDYSIQFEEIKEIPLTKSGKFLKYLNGIG